MKSRTLLIGALVATLGGCDRIQTFMIQRAASRALGNDQGALLQDGELHVVLCGTGSPVADAERAGPCTAVLAGGHFFLIDAGPGSSREVGLMRLPRAELDGLLLTHFHSDHIGEVGEVTVQSWIAGRSAPLTVYGPPGVEEVVDGFQRAYARDTQYRVAHHGDEAMPGRLAVAHAQVVQVPGPGETATVFDADGLRITAFAVDHKPIEPAYGYRIDYRGRSAVVSGDTKKSANLIRYAQGVDLLVHEALGDKLIRPVSEYARSQGLTRWAKLTSDILDYHTTPAEAAEVAREAQVNTLVLTHVVPPLQNFFARRLFHSGVSETWDGNVVLGEDGMHFRLPPDSKDVIVEEIDG